MGRVDQFYLVFFLGGKNDLGLSLQIYGGLWGAPIPIVADWVDQDKNPLLFFGPFPFLSFLNRYGSVNPPDPKLGRDQTRL